MNHSRILPTPAEVSTPAPHQHTWFGRELRWRRTLNIVSFALDFAGSNQYTMVIVLSGELAVPCTRNPL
jgi:hypothetical protein